MDIIFLLNTFSAAFSFKLNLISGFKFFFNLGFFGYKFLELKVHLY